MGRSVLRRVIAVGTIVVAALGAAVLAAPAASAAACSDLEVVFARGSGEFPGLGLVGTPLVNAVKSAAPTLSVTSYAVNYAADIAQTSAGPGATDMSNHVKSQAAACPNQRFVLGGYSQGASVVDIAIGIRTALGSGGTIPAELAPRVVTVTAFGNPLGLFRQTIKTASPTYGPRSIEFCNRADPVCGSTGTGPGNGHLSYGSDGSVTKAAAFVASQLATAARA